MPSQSRPSQATFASLLGEIRAEPGVVNALVVAPDGLLIAGAQQGEEEGELWAAVAAVLGNLGGRLAATADQGELESAVFTAATCQFVVRPIRMGFVLAVARPSAALDRVCTRVARAADKLDIFAGTLMGKRKTGGSTDA
jgi:predicted regulator of Ras-like GTPase activity (Roadblock/LC7/MglB family)